MAVLPDRVANATFPVLAAVSVVQAVASFPESSTRDSKVPEAGYRLRSIHSSVTSPAAVSKSLTRTRIGVAIVAVSMCLSVPST